MDNNNKSSIGNTATGQCSRKTPKERDILIGTWLGSARFGPNSDENVVSAEIDETSILKYVVHNRNTQGGILERPSPVTQQHIVQHKPLNAMERRQYVKVRNEYESGSTIELSGADDLRAVRKAQEICREFESVGLGRHQGKRVRFEKESWLDYASNSGSSKSAAVPVFETQHPTLSQFQAPRQGEMIFHDGVEYTRSYNGMFQGKHVSSPRIIQIDGEDYLKYIVLTKASPFKRNPEWRRYDACITNKCYPLFTIKMSEVAVGLRTFSMIDLLM
ncbi:hypothetical protein BOTNAR_0695g00010 [Botryotinia narcissicola]|uniref:Uncharacterized protein n=1 Tax=Botryotinia narcissicola TaxID=278944 RepID=A0A4Z1H7S9_9HELO|nr:hypothetical protein BOTNAR_0695g00010 [Botryotinia narcissicola]